MSKLIIDGNVLVTRFLFLGRKENYTIQSEWMMKNVLAVVLVTECVQTMCSK